MAMREAEIAGGSGQQGPPAHVTAAERARTTGEGFPESFERLQETIRMACADQSEWQGKITAGICAALDFAAREPTAARALTDRGKNSSQRADEVIDYFSVLLEEVAPGDRRFAISTDRAIVESVATLVRGHLLNGTTDRLRYFARELVYLTLLPYAGSADARTWSESLGLVQATGMS